MANTIGAVFTRVVEGVQNAFATLKNAIVAGFGSSLQTIMPLFAGKEKNTIDTTHPPIQNFLARQQGIPGRKGELLEAQYAKIKALKQNHRELIEASVIPRERAEERKNESEVAALLKPRPDVRAK